MVFRIDLEHFSARYTDQAYLLVPRTDVARGLLRLLGLRGKGRLLRVGSQQIMDTLKNYDAKAGLAGDLQG